MNRPDFEKLSETDRIFTPTARRLVGPIPTIAITPVADGRTGAYESNLKGTWELVSKIYDLIKNNVTLYDGISPNVVVAPEIVYGARSGARAQEYYATQGVSANIWVSRSWAYSDELMSACMGIGSSEWVQAAYGLNQTDRPGAVWLKAFTAAMDEKRRPIFAIYNPDLEDEKGPIAPFVAERLLRFSRCACAVAEMRGKNYLSIGGVSMGIIGSDVRRNLFHHYFGMGTVSTDMVAVKGRMDRKTYDEKEFQQAFDFMKSKFRFDFGQGKRPQDQDALLADCVRMMIIVKDMMLGNPALKDVEYAQGANAIASGTQGQRAWTDLYPNFDMVESLLCSSFDWTGFRPALTVATENDSKNAIGMLVANLLTGFPQLFSDIRTNWTAESIRKATGKDVTSICPHGLIDKRNSGAGALDYAANIYSVVGLPVSTPIVEVVKRLRSDKNLQEKYIQQCIENTVYMGANLEYFMGDGLSSQYRTPGNIPMTAYRYNVTGDSMTFSVVEGETVALPSPVADHISKVTDRTWPESFWAPRNMSSFEYMSRIGPNHDANSYGLIGDDMITLNAMLRIPVDFHNIPENRIFRPTLWERYGRDDFAVCRDLGPLYL